MARISAKKSRESSLTKALAAASWAEADRALAQALVEFAGLEAASGPAKRAEAMALVSQALARAARRRGLEFQGEVGEVCAYEPARHELISSAKRAPGVVKVVAPGIARAGKILLKARVSAVRAKAVR